DTEADSLVAELGRIGTSTNFNGTKLLDGSVATLNFQVGAGSTTSDTIAVSLASANVSAVAAGLSAISFASHASAQAAVSTIDVQIGNVSTARAQLGAYQNRFEHTIKNINVAVENLSASESRIRDTDMASEMVSFTRAQILSQAGTSMLAQANQIPQGVLSLLR
ncbi:flagellin, partial [Actinotalea solisilvae]|uniref:flagellin n=1 Tax=Actinotalea solisilvae TaxID=2072922 RepID=UPI002277E731